MRMRLLLATILGAGSVALFAPAAMADATVCYSASVTVNGDSVVNEADCHTVDTP